MGPMKFRAASRVLLGLGLFALTAGAALAEASAHGSLATPGLHRPRHDPLPPWSPEPFQGVWYEAAHSPRPQAAVVFDSRRGRLIQFGGLSGEAYPCAALWSFDLRRGEGWQPLVALGQPPAPRTGSAAVYDSVQDRVVLFGGYQRDSGIPAFDDLWELRLGGLPRWRRLEPAGARPGPRSRAGVALDARRRRMIVVGGERCVGSILEYHGMVFVNDAWSLDLAGAPVWTRLDPVGDGPPPTGGLAAAYDSGRDAVVLAGGRGALDAMRLVYRDEVWMLWLGESTRWELLGAASLGTTPPPNGEMSPSLVHDPATGRVVLFSGRDSITRAFVPGSDQPWVTLGAGAPGPGQSFGQAMVLDRESRQIALTGVSGSDALWRLGLTQGSVWSREAETGRGPIATLDFTLTSDPARGRALLVGGTRWVREGGRDRTRPVDEVWEFSLEGRRWSRLEGVRLPNAGLVGHRAVLDPSRDRLLLLGGRIPGVSPDSLIPNPFLYALSLSDDRSWGVERIEGWPDDLSDAPSVTHDPIGDRLLIQGDAMFARRPTRVWQLPLAGRSRLEPLETTGAPPAGSYGRATVFDPARQRMIVEQDPYQTGADDNASLWALSLEGTPRWSPIAPAGTPPRPTMRQHSAYDPARDRLVRFGGRWTPNHRTYQAAPGVWSLALATATTWDSLELQGPEPVEAREPTIAFDPRLRRLLVARARHLAPVADAYVLDFERPIRRVRALATRGHGHAIRRGPDAPGADEVAILSEPAFDATRLDPGALTLDGAPVERAAGRWRVWTADADGDGLGDLVCRFALGARLLREPRPRLLAGVDPEGFPLQAEVAVRERPDRAAEEPEREADHLAPEFHGAAPNPWTGGDLRVRFAVVAGEAAVLELLDLAGRRLLRLEVGARPGSQEVDLAGSAALRPGLYWARLSQADRSVTMRVARLR